MIPAVTVVAMIPARADPKRAVHSADPGAHCASDDAADRPGGALTTSRTFLCATDEPLGTRRSRRQGEPCKAQGSE